MINHKNIKQRSLEWYQIKWGRIGGTLSKGLFVKSDTLLDDILSQRLEDFELEEDGYQTPPMERGNELEPVALDWLEKYTGLKFKASGWLQCEENELLGISPDGITEDETIACEIKCLSRKAHTTILRTQETPLDKIHQIIHYFTVNPKLEKLYFCAFRPEAPKNYVKEYRLESLVNIGTNAKPVLKYIKEAKEAALIEAKNLLHQIQNEENKLKF